MESPTADVQKNASRPPPSAPVSDQPSLPGDEAIPQRAISVADRKRRAAAVKREGSAAALDELQTWLADLIRLGLASARQQPALFFETMAARMAEAQAPGIARRLREWPAIFAATGDEWASRALEELARMQWLLNGASRLDELSPGPRASVRSGFGWPLNEPELLAHPNVETVSGQWRIAGRHADEDHHAPGAQRLWLMGETTGRAALCASLAPDANLAVGALIDADLTFYPGPAPLRAAISARRRGDGATPPLFEASALAQTNFRASLDHTATLLAADPWLERAPWLVRDCIPVLESAVLQDGSGNETWSLRDRDNAAVPLARAFAHGWPLLAASAGAPVTIFGEWNGRSLLPLSVVVDDGRFIPLEGTLP